MKSHFMTSSFEKGQTSNAGWRVSVIPKLRSDIYILFQNFAMLNVSINTSSQYFSCLLKNVLCLPATKLKQYWKKEKRKKQNKTKQNKKNRRLLSTPRQLVALGWCSSQRLWGPYHLRSNGNFGSLAIFVVNVVPYPLNNSALLLCSKGNFVHVTWEIKRIWTTVMCLYDMWVLRQEKSQRYE